MKESVYLKAAKLISCEGDIFSCRAINNACGIPIYWPNPHKYRYERVFLKDNDGDMFTAIDVDLAGGKEWRLTALCLAAAMEEAGDL